MASNLPLSPSLHLPVAIGELIAGKYQVERVLGEGGMGIVLAARHRELDRHVAIKLLLPELAAVGMAAERFRREARASARIRGEHVCQVIDVGSLPNGVPYMVMEYLEGHDLATELELRGKLPYAEAVSYVLQACDAVATAHAEGLIHRDLKPANLFLERCCDGTRRIKVLDFGVSKSLLDTHSGASALTQTSNLLGSPLYMSPEQLDSAKSVDERSDIWSLGVVLYELITGRTPFDGDSIAQLVTAVLQASPRSLLDYAPEVPLELQAVVTRALTRPREARFRSVAALAQALSPFAAHQPALPHLARMSSLNAPVLASQPGAADPFGHTSHEGAPSGNQGGNPKRPRWVWLSLALAVGVLALIAQRRFAPATPRADAPTSAAEVAATTPPTAASIAELAAPAQPAALDLLTELAAATDPALSAARDAAVAEAPPPDSEPSALPASAQIAPEPARPEVRVQAARAATFPLEPRSGARAPAQPAASRVPPLSNFGGRR